MRRAAALLFVLAMAAGAYGDGHVTTSDGVRIHYLQRGPAKSGLTFVFIPGWMVPASIWGRQLDAMGRTHAVVAIDPRSQGESEKTAEGNYPARRARDVHEVLEKKNLRRVVLVASGSGVTDAAAYVEQFGTERIAALVLVHGVAGADYDSRAALGLVRWAQGFQTDRRARTEALVRSYFLTTPPPEPELRALIEGALKMPTSAAMAAFLGSFSADYRPALAKINKPTLIVVGESRWHDQYLALQQAIPGARLEKIKGTGHGLFIEAAGPFNKMLTDLAEQVGRVATP